MEQLLEHGDQLFILFISPILGLIIDYSLEKKWIWYLFYANLVLVIPMFFGYQYNFEYSNQIIGLFALGTLYSLFSKSIEKFRSKIILAVSLAVVAFCILGFFAFMSTMGGSQTVQNSWRIKNYEIEYIKDQGFSGGSLMKYEITKLTTIPILKKKVDVSVDNDSTNNCIIHFTDIKMDFDKCKNSLISLK